MSGVQATTFNVGATVGDDREITLTVEFKRTVTLPHALTNAQQVEFFTRLTNGNIKGSLIDTMEWAITGEDQ